MADAIAESQQRVHEVHVLGEHRLGHGDLHIGEVPETTDTQLHKMVGDRLRHMLRYRQNGDSGMMLGEVSLQLRRMAYLYAVDLRADEIGGEIESGVEMETHGGEIKVLHQSVAQVTCTNDDDLLIFVDAEDVTDLGAQLRHIVAIALLTELTEAAQILTDLRGGNIHLITQRVGGDTDNTLIK